MPLLEEAAIRIDEAARELSRYADSLELDNARQAAVEKRLAAAEELARKHRVSVGELPAHREALQAELEQLGNRRAGRRRRCAAQQAEALEVYRKLGRTAVGGAQRNRRHLQQGDQRAHAAAGHERRHDSRRR